MMRELPDLEQGTPEWHDQRRGLVTASVVGRLITPATIKPASNPESRSLTMLLAAERITGWTDPTYMNDDMLRGCEDEPLAVAVYEEHYAPVTTTGFMVIDEDWGTLGYSPDGKVGDDGLIEVKSPRAKKHLSTILNDEVPAENMAQIQAGLLVSGRDWLDYVSYCGGMPMFVKRVYPDAKWHAAIVEAVTRFEESVTSMVTKYHTAIAGLPTTERTTDLEMVI